MSGDMILPPVQWIDTREGKRGCARIYYNRPMKRYAVVMEDPDNPYLDPSDQAFIFRSKRAAYLSARYKLGWKVQ